MPVANRKDIRTKLKTIFDAALVGTGKPAQICYKFQRAAFEDFVDELGAVVTEADPNAEAANVSLIVLASAGGNRIGAVQEVPEPETLAYVNIHTFVLYEKEGQWTEEQSEDSIDDLEAGITNTMQLWMDRRNEAISAPADTPVEWLMARLISKSEVDAVFLEGIEYRHEVFEYEFETPNPS